MRLRCENISPPVTNSKTIYKLELSWKERKNDTSAFSPLLYDCLDLKESTEIAEVQGPYSQGILSKSST